MSNLQGTRHVLAVLDLKRSTEFYKSKIGMKLDWGDENWSFLSRDNFNVMLGECKDAIDPLQLGDHQYFAYVELEEIDTLYSDLVNKDVEITSEIDDKPWGQREFGIRTIDGHRIMFGKEI